MTPQIILLLAGLSLVSTHPYRRTTQDINTASLEINSLEQEEVVHKINNAPQNTIEATIKQVEDLLKNDPKLPRLTRGEILDLLENITVTEKLKLRDPKAIMVVMPYTPSNLDDKNLEDLYTKPPITQIIGEPNDEDDLKINKTKTRRRPDAKLSSRQTTEKTTITTINQNIMTTTTNPARRRRPTLTTQTPEISLTTAIPESLTTLKRRRPLRRKTTTTTTTTRSPAYYPEITTELPSDGIQIVDSPNLFIPQKINNIDLLLDDSNKKEVILEHAVPVGGSPTTPKPLSEDIGLPENFHNVVKDLNLDTAIVEHERPKIPQKDHDRIKELLASIGAVTTTTTTTTTTTIMPDVANVANSLSPEMKELLISFGLMPNPNEKPQIVEQYNPETAETRPDSYVGFKPLPETDSTRDDMEALLASFGLARNSRKQKSIRSNRNKNQSGFDVVPDNFKGVLKDLGIENLPQETKIVQKTVEKQHVFNPDLQYATEDELKKLNKLLETIKQLEKLNGTATEEDLKKIDLDGIKELVGSLNNEQSTLDQKNNSPNPLRFDLGISKNEVKRQEITTTSTAPTTTTTTTTTTTEEPRNPPLADLEASFGGQMSTTQSPPETTTRIFTGFYRLVDWNTFLDIDDQKGRRVNLRFQPKVGDPKRFLSVTVP